MDEYTIVMFRMFCLGRGASPNFKRVGWYSHGQAGTGDESTDSGWIHV